MRSRPAIILSIFLLSCCKPDFNPETDSLMCTMDFAFDTRNLFSTVLVQDGETFRKGKDAVIPTGYQLRITSYCYDSEHSLVRTDQILSDTLSDIELKVPYIFSSEKYTFIFIADFVADGSPYWYPLSTVSLPSAYLRRSNNIRPTETMFAFRGQWEGTPIPESITVGLEAVTYNCFCIFQNLDGLDKIEISLGYRESVHLCSTEPKTSRYAHSEIHYSPDKAISIPLVLVTDDDNLHIEVCTKYLSEMDTLSGFVENPSMSPFVLTVDGATLDNNIDLYE